MWILLVIKMLMKVLYPSIRGYLLVLDFHRKRGPPQARKFFFEAPWSVCPGANLWFFGTRKTAHCLEPAQLSLQTPKASDWWNASFYAFRSRSHYLWVRQWVRDTLHQSRENWISMCPLKAQNWWFYYIHSTKLWGIIKYTANVYRQTTDKLMFKSVISTVRWIRK